MNEIEWVTTSEKIQMAALRENKISPLDILVLMGKRLDYYMASNNWERVIYRKFRDFQKQFIGSFDRIEKWNRGAVFFFPTEPTHLNQMLPVANLLVSQGVRCQFVTPKPKIYRSLLSGQFDVFLVLGSKVRQENNAMMSFKQIRNALDGTGCEGGLPIVKSYYNEIGQLSQSLSELLGKLVPIYVFIGNDLTWECRLLARLCQLMRLRTGMIQHGLLGHEIYNRLHVVNDIFVYGPAFKRVLEMDGLEGANIVVTGAPYLDSKSFKLPPEPNQLIKHILDLSGSYILVAFSGSGDRTSAKNYEIILSWIKHLMDEHPELDIVVKLHRKERLRAYASFSQKQHRRIIDRSRGRDLPSDIFEWFKGCSCLITGTSTVAYEAMLYNIPIISVDPIGEYKGINFIDEKAVDIVSTYQDLEDTLLSVLDKKKDYQPFMSKIFAGTDGESANRIAYEVRRIVGI